MQNPSVPNTNTGAVLDMKAERKPASRSANSPDERFEKHLERKEKQEARANAIAKAEAKAQSRADAKLDARQDARQQAEADAKVDSQTKAAEQRAQLEMKDQKQVAAKSVEEIIIDTDTVTPVAEPSPEPHAEVITNLADSNAAETTNLGFETIVATPDAPIDTPTAQQPALDSAPLLLELSPQTADVAVETSPAAETSQITPPADKLAAHITKQQIQAAATPAPQLQMMPQPLEQKPNTLNGLDGRSLVGDVLGETMKLDQASVSPKALAANASLKGQPDTAFGSEIRNQLEQAFGKSKPGSPTKAEPAPMSPLPAGLNMLDKTGATMALETPAAPLDQEAIAAELMQLGEEGAAQSAKAAEKPDINQLKAMATAAANAAPANASAKKTLAPKTLGASVGSEIAGLDKLAALQNLTSTSAKPELANLPSRAAQAVPVQNVGMHIARKAMEGQNRFEIRIDPPELGRIEVKLDIGDDGKMRAHLTVEKAETLDLLQRDQRALERAMQQGGMKGFEDLSFSLKDQGNGNAGQNANQNGQQEARANQNGAGGKGDATSADTMTPFETIAMNRAQARAAMGGVDLNV